MVRPKFILLTIIIVLLAILLLQNSDVVSLKIYFWEISMSRIIFFPVLIFVGFIAGFIVAKLVSSRKERKRIMKSR